jgi:hypothetical protein
LQISSGTVVWRDLGEAFPTVVKALQLVCVPHRLTSPARAVVAAPSSQQDVRVTPAEAVAAWFAAQAAGDLQAARALLAPGARVDVQGQQLTGFDEFMSWYRQRAAAEGPNFTYDLVEVLSGERYSAALLTLTTREGPLLQVAIYRVVDGVITSIWLVEGIETGAAAATWRG